MSPRPARGPRPPTLSPPTLIPRRTAAERGSRTLRTAPRDPRIPPRRPSRGTERRPARPPPSRCPQCPGGAGGPAAPSPRAADRMSARDRVYFKHNIPGCCWPRVHFPAELQGRTNALGLLVWELPGPNPSRRRAPRSSPAPGGARCPLPGLGAPPTRGTGSARQPRGQIRDPPRRGSGTTPRFPLDAVHVDPTTIRALSVDVILNGSLRPGGAAARAARASRE